VDRKMLPEIRKKIGDKNGINRLTPGITGLATSAVERSSKRQRDS
jgi:hypothetical protein